MKKIIKRRIAQPEYEQSLLEFHPILRRIYANRGIQSAHELCHDLDQLLKFQSLNNIQIAVEFLAASLIQQKHFLIIGDFDADGATSTTLAVLALRAFGAKQVNYLVPNRFEYGYGLTPEIVVEAAKLKPDVIITVDNGIASVAGVAKANDYGIDVIITDHHLPGRHLPDAKAIVNPNLNGDAFPSKSLAGVGVIFYVMSALRRYLIEKNYFSDQQINLPKMSDFLDLVALGTVADVVALDQNNRILVKQGLERIRRGGCRPGIKALFTIAGKELATVTEADLGFALGPRLNAAGRLDDMSLGIECLLTQDFSIAMEYAAQLNQLNIERKQIEMDMQQQALTALEKIHFNDTSLPAGICLFDENWHQGVIGILASRIKDHYHRPVIAFAKINEQELKGSARSINGIHIRDILDTLATHHPHLITKFGGHAMAAGLSIAPHHLPEFARVFSTMIEQHSSSDLFTAQLFSDGELKPEEITLNLAELLQQAGPFGQHFPEPCFDGEFYILDQRLVGQKHLKLTLSDLYRRQQFEAIAFNINLREWPNYHCDRVRLVYQLDINEFRGVKRLQLLVRHLESVEVVSLV
ncbi:MAG: single-stranded-DNA-specific exonuclease RecJ [Legionellales bacterium]|nr:single-stranded-DNA-specific exonuclease RecJ [Legionellales bacterium]